jgi:hypothetical protein
MAQNNREKGLLTRFGGLPFAREAAAISFLVAPMTAAPTAANAQTRVVERATAASVYRTESTNPLIVPSLGENPVSNRVGAPISLVEVRETREALAATTDDWAEPYLEYGLRALNGYNANATDGAVSDQALIRQVRDLIASAPRIGGDTQPVDVTALLRANGYQIAEGVVVTMEANSVGLGRVFSAGTQADGVDGVKIIPLGTHDGITLRGDGDGAAEGIDIVVARTQRGTAGGQTTQRAGMFFADDCGNGYGHLQYRDVVETAAALSREATDPCVTVRVRVPRGVNLADERADIRVVTLDLGRGGAFPAEECPAEEQVTVNCEGPCSDLMVNAAHLSEPFQRVLQRVRRERGADAQISRFYTPDATFIPDAARDGEGSVRLQIRRSQINSNVAVIICFDWPGGGSEIVTLTDIDTNTEGVITANSRGGDFELNMSNGGNVEVFRGERRGVPVVRGTGRLRGN